MSIFGGAPSQSRTRNLLEFKAGKMILRGTMVYPDKRKGLVYVHQGPDMLMHLCWKDRASSGLLPEDDLVIFPDEVEFKRVTQNTTGRVYILKWRNTPKKIFFWMQEPKEDKDDEHCKKVNDLLNHPPTPGFGEEAGGAGGIHALQPFMEQMASGGAGGLNANDLNNVLRGIHPQDFASLLSSFGAGGAGAAGLMQGTPRAGTSTQRTGFPLRLDRTSRQPADSRPNTAPASTRSAEPASGVAPTTRTTGASSRSRDAPATSSSSAAATATNPTDNNKSKSNPIQLSALTNVLSTLGASATPTAPSDVKKPENFASLLSNKDVQEKLRSHLPADWTLPTNEQECREKIDSTEYRQALTAFETALQSGQLSSVLSSLNYPPDVIQAGDLKAFAQALDNFYQGQGGSSMETN